MFNAQSVVAHINEIKIFVDKYEPAVLALTETHLTQMVEDQEISIEGYDVVRVDSSSRHTGGVCVYIKHGVKYSKKDEYISHKNCWVLVVKITIKKWSTVLACFYRSPSGSQARFLEYFSEFCDEYVEVNGTIIIMGDFNMDWRSDQFYPRKLKMCVNENSLKQIVNDVTHISRNSRTTIDLVFTNDNTLSTELFENSGISCHRAVRIKKQTPGVESRKVTIRKRVTDRSIVAEKLKDVRMDPASGDLGSRLVSFINRITGIIDECNPRTEIWVKHNRNPWFNDIVEEAVKTRNRAYSRYLFTDTLEDWNKYKGARNDAVRIIENEKRRFYEKKIDDNKRNSVVLWKTLKTLVKSKGNESCQQIRVGSDIFDKPDEIATKFNDYFITSIENISNSIQTGAKDSDNITSDPDRGWTGFEISDIQMLKKIVFDMENKGSPDEINVKFIKEYFEEIGDNVLYIINESLSKGEVPDELKVSTVVPVRKVPRSVNIEDFRPINMLPALEKILERVVYNQLLEFVQRNKVLSDYQSGFRRNFSCETAFQVVINDWKEALNSGESVIAVFLDLKRAFETIDRQKLLKKLKKLWCRRYSVGMVR